MIKGFQYRLVVLFLIVAGFSLFILFISILPSYFFSSVKVNLAEAKLENQKNEPVPSPDQETLKIVKDLDIKLKILEDAERNTFLVSQKVINPILSKKMPEIKITKISYENDPLKGRQVMIEGTAPSREMLLSFRLALEHDSAFKHVDLPISNFVKGSNIQFYLTLTPS